MQQKNSPIITKRIAQTMSILGPFTQKLQTPLDPLVAVRNNDPFRALISTILTAQTKDQVSAPVSQALFVSLGDTTSELANAPISHIEDIIRQVSYYKTKARHIQKTASIIHTVYKDVVPRTYEELIALPGVGPKTANLMLGEVFGIPAICVDIHVHRISNRLGIIRTKTREQSLKALEQTLPKKYWIPYNNILVKLGQMICRPISPKCSECPAKDFCPKIGVTSKR
ncbi:MAG: endonuclease III domain-containing protein [Candidatus Woesearchaeota archaeon]